MNIFTYWEGKLLDYLRLSLVSLLRLREKVNVYILTPEMWCVVDSVLHPSYKMLRSPAHRADCIRVAALYLYGGWWADADTLWLRDPKHLVMDKDQFLYLQWKSGRVLNGYMYGTRGCPVLGEWLDRINFYLKGGSKSFSWMQLGEECITPIVREYEKHTTLIRNLPLHTFIPIDFCSDPQLFFRRGENLESYLMPDTVAIAFNHDYFVYHYYRLMYRNLKHLVDKGDMLFNQVIRKGLSQLSRG